MAAANFAAFISYAVDKSAARKDTWRISEATLHILELLGGWPSALLAQQYLRHKTRKLSFQLTFYLAALLNSAALTLLIFPQLYDSLIELLAKAS